MPKRNSSSSSSNRRASSSRSTSARKSFKSKEGSDSKPFKKFDKKDSGKPFRKRTDEGASEEKRKPYASRSDKPSGNRPFKKFDRRGTDSSFGKKEDNSSEGKGRSFSGSKRQSFEKPFAKGGRKDSGKTSYSRREDNSSDQKRSFSKPERRSSKPFNKSDNPRSAPRREDSSDKKRPFSNKSEGRSSRPFNKSDNPRSAPRREDNDFDQKRSSSKPERRSSKPFNSRSDNPRSAPRRENKTSDKKERGFLKQKESTAPVRTSAKKVKPFDEAPEQGQKIRLNKFIANSGVCSRREADELITMGLISVNGKTITELGYKVNPGDEVRHESKVLKAEKPVYLLLNKPKGYLTTTNDPQERNTVMHLLGNAVKERVYPVGRLDRNTTGLLLLTNDGELAEKLMHPSYNVKKIYKVELDRPLTKADFQRIQEGVQLEEGRAMVDDVAVVSDDGKTVGVELHIGWNRVVRRIFEALGYEVLKLDRSVYAGLDKKDLPRGHWRLLKQEEITWLKHYK